MSIFLDTDDEFNIEDYILTPRKFFETRRISNKVHVFDLRSSEDYESFHLPQAVNLPFENFEDSIYQMPFSGEIMLYGSNEKDTFSAAEILYDNGFENFYVIATYDSLITGVDESFINISEKAKKKISKGNTKGIQIIIESKTDTKANYSVQYIELSATPINQTISIDLETFQVFVAKESIPYLEGTEVSLTKEGKLEAFNQSMSIKQFWGTMEERIQYVLDEEINPMVASHGGVVSLLEVKDQNVYLEFGGGCQGCGMIDVTLKQGVEVLIKEQLPEIESIYDVTDHANGDNPYYNPSEK